MHKRFLPIVTVIIVLSVFLLISCSNEIQLPQKPGIRGRISLPASSELVPEEIWVKAVEGETTKYVGRVNPDGTFLIPNLDSEKKYNIHFTSIEPEFENKRSVGDRAAGRKPYGGWLTDVSASIDASVGSVKMKPLGTIKGTAIKTGAADNYDVMVYIPGTSLMAMTDAEGNFSITNVPQGTHRIRYTSSGYLSLMKEGVVLASDSDDESPTKVVAEASLIREAGIVRGTATLKGAQSHEGIIIRLEGADPEDVATGTTAEDGAFLIPDVKPGTYSALISYPGHVPQRLEGITVRAAETTSIGQAVALSANGGDITGKITLNDGKPLSGAAVLATITIDGKRYSFSTTTDAGGTYVLNNCPLGDGYEISITKTGYATVIMTGVSVLAGVPTVIPEKLLSSEYGSINGTVQDTRGNGLSGAQVLMKAVPDTGSTYTATTDGAGSFSKSGIAIGSYEITISKDGYSDLRLAQNVRVESSGTATLGIQKLTSLQGSIRGTVSLNDGRTAEGTVISATSGTNSYPATVESDGTYSIGGMLPGSYQVTASKEGYESSSMTVSVVADRQTEAGTLTLASRSGSIKVQVGYGDKEVDDRITVSISKGGTAVRTATTSNSPILVFSGIPVGSGYTVTASAEGYSSSEAVDVVVESTKETSVILNALSSRFGSINGTVQDTRGNGLSGAQVLMKAVPDTGSTYTATTDGAGSFSKSGIAIGSYEITISKDGYSDLRLAQSVRIESSGTATLGIQKLTSLQGSISGMAKLQGAGDHTGILVSATGTRSYTASTGADGSYTISGMEPGNYELSFTKAGYVNQTANVAVEADKTSLVPETTLISSSCAITGSVVLEGSPGNSGVTVSATLVGDQGRVVTATTLEDGTYYIGGLDVGQYSIQIQMNGYVTDRSKLVYTTYGNTTVIDPVVLKSVKATVRGSVTLIGTNVHTGISVMLKTPDNQNQYDATTAQDGAFVITGVQPGIYSLYVSKAGYESKAVDTITIEPSSEKTIDNISLAVAQRSIYGNVQLELRTDHAGALITATKTSDPHKVYSAISNSAGDYSLAGMEPGEYRIVITSAGYRTLTMPTTDVTADSTADLGTAELIIARGTISGIVTLEGRSSQEGTKVELLGTGYEILTNELGEYSFNVPQGNYPGGIRFTRTDFKSDSHADTIPVLTDSTYAVPARELKATHVSIHGTVDVQGTDDDSAVTISFDNGTHPEILTTDENGSFRFDHVVLGSHTIRFSRENAPDITVQAEAMASDGINVGTVRLTPNSASIHGIVRLRDATSYSGVKVEVDVQDKGKISTLTGPGGDYYIGGIYSVGTHTVTFSKDGWDSESTTVSNLAPLEDREMSEVTLIDTTSPILRGLTINSGANTAANKVVTLHVDASDLGSGISKMQICYDNVFDQTVTMRDYSPSFEWELPSGNGLKTVYMKVHDAAGNASNVISASVTLTDQKKEVWGVLTGEDLHWTKEKSPYLVTGNILVERDKTLTIDPGVDVQFPGAYSLQIEGTLEAIGTEQERISFYGIDNAEWNGINGENDAGNRLSHVAITHLRNGILGHIDIDHSEISSVSGYAFGGIKTGSYNDRTFFRGTARENEIVGKINTYEASLFRNAIQDDETYIEFSFLSGNEFSGGSSQITIRSSLGENNKFEGKTLTLDYSGMINTSFNSCRILLSNGGLYNKNSYSDCDFLERNYGDPFSPAKLINSNLINCGLITIGASRSDYEEIDMTGNFWGYDKTREMTEKGVSSNLSFIHDYYDDFNKTKAVYSGYLNKPIEGVGYLGDAYYPVVAESPTMYQIGDTGPAGGKVFYDKGFYSEGWRYLEAAPADLGGYIIFGYYKATAKSILQRSGTSPCIGAGRINTRMLVDTMGDLAYSGYVLGDGTREADYAAKFCQDLSFNGFDDWFLPSRDESRIMYNNLKRNGLGDFDGHYYWTSTESINYSGGFAMSVDFYSGSAYSLDKSYNCKVHPVRAF